MLVADGPQLLSQALRAIDECEHGRTMLLFVVVGCEKAFSILRLRHGILSVDTHQRTEDGIVGPCDICVVQMAPSAYALHPLLCVGPEPAYREDVGYE